MAKQLIIWLASVVLMSSCSTDNIREASFSKRLCKHQWVVNTYVDNSINQVLDVPDVIYQFSEDGVLTKTYSNGETHTASWSFSEDAGYLTMGNNTFRVNTLTSKVLSLSYGEIDIFYIPAD
ncbi:MAG TPA: hypothetical protein PLZ52_11475 [Bacteroidales bacterium]|nr:hypothetical protein [Bacteroidales bacterium]HOE05829.1 hypothetical protein [Bacteroidales bacterium]